MESSSGFLKSKPELLRNPVVEALSPYKNKIPFHEILCKQVNFVRLFKGQDIFSLKCYYIFQKTDLMPLP